ncbi:uncharacterized protein FFB14_12718 [Fusarium fujikuroi]|nr:uncharacterized protein FFB14_12718 [Fusarium fujikuroi]
MRTSEAEFVGDQDMRQRLIARWFMVRTVNVLESPKMDKSLIKAKFYSLVQTRLVFYDQEQKTVEYLDRGLKVQANDCTAWRIVLTLLTAVSVLLTEALSKKPTIQTDRAQAQQNNESPQQNRGGGDISTAGYEICDVDSTRKR